MEPTTQHEAGKQTLFISLSLIETNMAHHNLSCSVREVNEVKFYTYHVHFRTQFLSLILIKFSIIFSHYWWGCVEIWNCQEEREEGLCVYDHKLWSAEPGATLRDGESMAIGTSTRIQKLIITVFNTFLESFEIRDLNDDQPSVLNNILTYKLD